MYTGPAQHNGHIVSDMLHTMKRPSSCHMPSFDPGINGQSVGCLVLSAQITTLPQSMLLERAAASYSVLQAPQLYGCCGSSCHYLSVPAWCCCCPAPGPAPVTAHKASLPVCLSPTQLTAPAATAVAVAAAARPHGDVASHQAAHVLQAGRHCRMLNYGCHHMRHPWH